jgi:hypothetical protein
VRTVLRSAIVSITNLATIVGMLWVFTHYPGTLPYVLTCEVAGALGFFSWAMWRSPSDRGYTIKFPRVWQR